MSRTAFLQWLAPLALAWCLALAGAGRPSTVADVGGAVVAAGTRTPEIAEADPSAFVLGQTFRVSSRPAPDVPRERLRTEVGGTPMRGRFAASTLFGGSRSCGPSARERRVRHLDFWMGDALARIGAPSWRSTAPPRVRAG